MTPEEINHDGHGRNAYRKNMMWSIDKRLHVTGSINKNPNFVLSVIGRLLNWQFLNVVANLSMLLVSDW